MTPKSWLSVWACGMAMVLSGCDSSADADLKRWMQTERNAIKPKVTPIQEPTKFTPESYSGERSIEPFSREKLLSALRASTDASIPNSRLIAPEMSRRKQPLEAFPLDTMFFVGSLEQNGQLVALVKVDKLLYQVRQGNYLGQNYGRVMKISETELVLREIVQDAAGEWIERPAELQLKEEAK